MWPTFAGATVDLEKIGHDTPLSENNNAVDNGLLVTPMTVDWSDAIHWGWFSSICCEFLANLFV